MQGGFGAVVRAELLPTGQQVAVKVPFQKSKGRHLDNAKAVVKVEQEANVGIAQAGGHPNIINFLGSVYDPADGIMPWLCFDMARGGTVQTLLRCGFCSCCLAYAA